MAAPDDARPRWQPCRASPLPGAREVHVWRVELERPRAEVEALESHLSADERAGAARLALARHRARALVGRGALRHVLGAYLSAPPGELAFRYGPRGKPELAGAWAGRLHFNVSHSQGLALLAVAGARRVGVDVEHVRPVPDALDLAARYFARGEAAALRAVPPDALRSAFFRCWTRKEAYVKAIGDGLAIPLDSFEVSTAADALDALRSVGGSVAAAARWRVRDVAPAAGYAGAVAFEGGDGDVVRLHLDLAG